MGIRSWIKHKAKKIKHEAEKAADKVKDTVEDAADAIDDTANEALKQAEKLAEEAEKELKRAIMSILDDVKKLAGKAKHEIEGAANKAKHEIGGTANSAKHEIEAVAKDAKKEVQGGLNQVKDEVEKLPKHAEDALQEAMNALFKAISKEGLKKVRDLARTTSHEMGKLRESKPDLVDSIDALGFSVELGPLTLSWSEFYERSEEVSTALDTFISHPPELRRRPILQLIEGIGPTTIDAGLSVQVAA